MANTDRPLSPGIFAADAQTTVPANPVPGVSYRDPLNGLTTIGLGWPFQRLVNSAEFKEVMFRITSLLDMVCRTSVLAWNEQVDYQAAGATQTPSVVASTDGHLYVALQPSGPNKGGARDPATGNSAYWSQFSGLAAGADVGDVKTVATEEPPLGWLKCNGAVVSRTQYAALFDVIGTRFGAGNGSTTFGLPDLRGEFVRGWDDGRGVDPGRELGSEQEGQNALHSHEASTSAAGGHNHEASTAAAGGHGHQATVGEAGGHSHSGGTTVDGDHRHGLTMGLTNLDSGYFGGGASVYGTQYTNIAGAHSHSITTDATPDHSHTVSIALAPDHTHEVTVNAVPDHSHAVTVSSSGGYESRPRSVALLYVIKY